MFASTSMRWLPLCSTTRLHSVKLISVNCTKPRRDSFAVLSDGEDGMYASTRRLLYSKIGSPGGNGLFANEYWNGAAAVLVLSRCMNATDTTLTLLFSLRVVFTRTPDGRNCANSVERDLDEEPSRMIRQNATGDNFGRDGSKWQYQSNHRTNGRLYYSQPSAFYHVITVFIRQALLR